MELTGVCSFTYNEDAWTKYSYQVKLFVEEETKVRAVAQKS